MKYRIIRSMFYLGVLILAPVGQSFGGQNTKLHVDVFSRPESKSTPITHMLGSPKEGRLYPKLALYTRGVDRMSSLQLDTLSWYDKVVIYPPTPLKVAQIRQRNPNIQLFVPIMPQGFVKWDENQTWWYADTTRSIQRLAQFYAMKNQELGADWYLRTNEGKIIEEWNQRVANWTKYCPKGRYGTSKGKTYVEWLVDVAIPQIVLGNEMWERWGEGSSSFQGIMLEVIVDCPALWNVPDYRYADPKQDGQILGVYSSCESGGNSDPLSKLFAEMNAVFWAGLEPLQLGSDAGGTLIILMNGGHSHTVPWWRDRMNGIKLEGWLSWYRREWEDWWGGFYGFKRPGGPVTGTGYKWSETFLKPRGEDPLSGWGRTILQIMPSFRNLMYAERLKRLGLGTSLLGEGYFSFTYDEKGLYWQPEYNWDFGTPIREYSRETYLRPGGVDTLYVREFTKGFVEVNPHETRSVNGVGRWDTRFGFWQTIDNLRAEAEGRNSIRVSFTAPNEELSPVEGIEVRYSLMPITLENWDKGILYSGEPVETDPGSEVQIRVDGLRAGTIYHFGLRNIVYGRYDPNLSNIVSVRTTHPSRGTLLPSAR